MRVSFMLSPAMLIPQPFSHTLRPFRVSQISADTSEVVSLVTISRKLKTLSRLSLRCSSCNSVGLMK